MNYFSGILSLIFLAMLLSSCQSEAEKLRRQELVDRTLEERLAEYRQASYDNCRKDILAKAKMIADSTLLANAIYVKVFDSLPRPPKPQKPGTPQPKTLKDTLGLAPILPLESDSSSLPPADTSLF